MAETNPSPPVKTEAQIINEVMAEWNSGAGGSISVRAILWMVNALRKAYGDKTTIDGVRTALERLERNAETISGELWHKKAERLAAIKADGKESG